MLEPLKTEQVQVDAVLQVVTGLLATVLQLVTSLTSSVGSVPGT
ncbi:Holin [Caenorhabditis elegans]|uniref:Holin n=1 Tax=Caenorhabditis elegans TaxID=6239 RepID=G1K0Z8_CAEEL|nr:Holin [Caenorhabditis elegans]CCC42149.1 Holin [Caenorhabditis elegans]|eukprot:NP_001256759.1 Uncharacterized protein CELE_C06H5.11 [Caenorhabditis elegans]